MVRGERRLPLLQLGVSRQRVEPSLRRIAKLTHADAGVGEKQPSPRLIVSDDPRDQTRRSTGERHGQAWLESLYGGASLEPDLPAAHRHPRDDSPRSVVGDLRGSSDLDVPADPLPARGVHARDYGHQDGPQLLNLRRPGADHGPDAARQT